MLRCAASSDPKDRSDIPDALLQFRSKTHLSALPKKCWFPSQYFVQVYANVHAIRSMIMPVNKRTIATSSDTSTSNGQCSGAPASSDPKDRSDIPDSLLQFQSKTHLSALPKKCWFPSQYSWTPMSFIKHKQGRIKVDEEHCQATNCQCILLYH